MSSPVLLNEQKRVFGEVGCVPLSSCAVSTTHPVATTAMIDLLKLRGPKGIASFKDPIVGEAAQRLRVAGGKLFASDAANISIIQNCRDGLEMIFNAVREVAPSRAKILLYEHEYPSNFHVWTRPGSKFGLDTVIVRGKAWQGKPLKFSVEDLIQKIGADKEIKVLTVSQVQFQSGFALSTELLARLGAICKQHGVVFVVDAAQSLGSTPLYPEKISADVVVSSGWKWNTGPEGVGLMYTSPEFRERFNIGPYGGDNRIQATYPERDFTLHADGRRYEPSTISRTNIVGLQTALDNLIVPVGLEAIEKEIKRLQKRFLAQLSTPKIRLVPLSDEERIGILSFELAEKQAGDLKTHLWDRGIVVPSPQGGYCRVAIHAFNTDAQVDEAAAQINLFLQ